MISKEGCIALPVAGRTPYERLRAALAEAVLRERVGAPASPHLSAAFACWRRFGGGSAE